VAKFWRYAPLTRENGSHQTRNGSRNVVGCGGVKPVAYYRVLSWTGSVQGPCSTREGLGVAGPLRVALG
jgi:hypothetical protein